MAIPDSMLDEAQKKMFEPLIKDGSYMPISEIGKGTYGSVVKAFCTKTNQFVAIKRISDFDKWEYLTL